MDNERLSIYLRSLEPEPTPLIAEIEAHAAREQVPIIRKETASLLQTLIVMNQPKRILEVGAATGYSALCMSVCMPEDAHLTTIEKYEKRIPVAKENFRRAGMEEKITLMEGDAADILKELAGPYDFIFMDAAKGQYLHFLPEVLRLLAEGGVLVTDNVLQDGYADGVPLRGGAPGPHDSCADAGLSVYADPYAGASDHRWCRSETGGISVKTEN